MSFRLFFGGVCFGVRPGKMRERNGKMARGVNAQALPG